MQKNCCTTALALTLMLTACGGNKNESGQDPALNADSLNRPENVKLVAAIAKVEPANGLIELSADVSGIIIEMYKKEGDNVTKGDVIFKLDKENESLQVTSARQEITAQVARVAAAQSDVKQFEASLKEKQEDLAITEKLAATGADTRQNLSVKQKERDVLAANLDAAKAQLKMSQSELESLKTKLSQTELTATNRLVKARESGVLVSLNAKKGSAVTAYTPFGSLAPEGELVVHGEIDEMFAPLVRSGQSVDINYVGSTKVIATGAIIYLSPMLENKSLFYEKTGENSDRRVRLFKSSLNAQEPLLINAKVECKIKIQ